MKNKLIFLTKMSLNKKVKTKWFLIANMIFAILIIGLINIDSVIKLFGGDFNETQEILVIDEVGIIEEFKNNFEIANQYVSDFEKIEIINYSKNYDEGIKEVEEEDKKLFIISNDNENYIRAKLVSNEGVGTITNTLISTSLTTVRSSIVLSKYEITKDIYTDINKQVTIENEILSENNTEDDLMMSTLMQILTLPMFMLIIFLVQMIGAEVNEEKATKSMEIIISNVSPKVHFISKIISANLFVIIQASLLIIFAILGITLRYFLLDGNIIGELEGELVNIIGTLSLSGVIDSLTYMLPIILVIMLLTFIAYSLLAGILASMTTNLEDFQQLQTPIIIISLIGYYLSMMAGMFKGSIFIKIMSYMPFISSLLSPTLYVMGEITIIDLLISILLLIGTIYILIKYGLRIYKVGILNYSGNGLWKKMAKAIKER